jgi:hypothetical protein
MFMSIKKNTPITPITIIIISIIIVIIFYQPYNKIFADDINVSNGIQFTDINGDIIHAHGGGMIKYDSNYYWYGEYRDSDNKFLGVRCYKSTDLKNWELRGEVLSPDSDDELNSCNVERPKVMYNDATKQFVMWMHWENGDDYGDARAAVAYCETPDGEFTYEGSFRPYENSGITDHDKGGYMSRDCNVFVDDDGTGYFISSSNENMDLHLYKLTDDYKNIDTLVTKLYVGNQREAPCLFKRNGYYYLLTSGCTGWSPNQAKYAYSKNLDSGWSSLIDIGDSTIFNSQPAFVLSIQGSDTFLYLGDRWAGAYGGDVNDSTYVWLPLVFKSDTNLELQYTNKIAIDMSSNSINKANETYYKIVNRNSGKVLDIPSNSTQNGIDIIQYTYNGGLNQKWIIEDIGDEKYKVIACGSNKLLEVEGWSTRNGAIIDQWTDNGGNNQVWELTDLDNGYYKISNLNSGKVLDVKDESTSNNADVIQYTYTGNENQQWELIEVSID